MSKKIKKITIKDFLVFFVGFLGLLYSLNFSIGIFEFLPDTLPLIGHIDEAVALFLVYSACEYFNLNIKFFFVR